MIQRNSQPASTLRSQDAVHQAAPALRPYVSSTSEKYAPGNFVTTWNPEIGRDAVGVTRAIEDVQEANPRVLVKWMHDLSEEWVRAEYLHFAN